MSVQAASQQLHDSQVKPEVGIAILAAPIVSRAVAEFVEGNKKLAGVLQGISNKLLLQGVTTAGELLVRIHLAQVIGSSAERWHTVIAGPTERAKPFDSFTPKEWCYDYSVEREPLESFIATAWECVRCEALETVKGKTRREDGSSSVQARLGNIGWILLSACQKDPGNAVASFLQDNKSRFPNLVRDFGGFVPEILQAGSIVPYLRLLGYPEINANLFELTTNPGSSLWKIRGVLHVTKALANSGLGNLSLRSETDLEAGRYNLLVALALAESFEPINGKLHDDIGIQLVGSSSATLIAALTRTCPPALFGETKNVAAKVQLAVLQAIQESARHEQLRIEVSEDVTAAQLLANVRTARVEQSGADYFMISEVSASYTRPLPWGNEHGFFVTVPAKEADRMKATVEKLVSQGVLPGDAITRPISVEVTKESGDTKEVVSYPLIEFGGAGNFMGLRLSLQAKAPKLDVPVTRLGGMCIFAGNYARVWMVNDRNSRSLTDPRTVIDGPVEDISVVKTLSAYELDTIARIGSWFGRSMKGESASPVGRALVHVPDIEYLFYLYAAEERGRSENWVAPALIEQWLSALDERTERLFRVFSNVVEAAGGVAARERLERYNPLAGIRDEFIGCFRAGNPMTLQEVVEKLRADDPWWRRLTGELRSAPETWQELAYLSYLYPTMRFGCREGDETRRVVSCYNPIEFQIHTEAQGLAGKHKLSMDVVACFPYEQLQVVPSANDLQAPETPYRLPGRVSETSAANVFGKVYGIPQFEKLI